MAAIKKLLKDTKSITVECSNLDGYDPFSCSECRWQGQIEAADHDIIERMYAVRCPDCGTTLASVSYDHACANDLGFEGQGGFGDQNAQSQPARVPLLYRKNL